MTTLTNDKNNTNHPGDQHETPGYQPHSAALSDLKSRITLHYDLASTYYHRLWGQHIHHGLFTDEITTKEAAQVNLIDHLVKLSGITTNATVLDTGCGIGGTTRFLAKQRGCEVTGITISSEQVKIARQITAEEVGDANAVARADDEFTPFGSGKVRYIHLDAEKARDYFTSQGHEKSFDYVWISEALSHFPRPDEFFKTAFALLARSGSKLVIADWFRDEGLTAEQVEADIKPIEDGMLLPGLKTIQQYVDMAEAAGFKTSAGPEDISQQVKKTWDISWSLVSSPSLWAFAIAQGRDGLAFLQSFRAMRRGYANGSFRYAVMVFEKP